MSSEASRERLYEAEICIPESDAKIIRAENTSLVKNVKGARSLAG